ncbi:MAG: sodium:proton antiporter [Pirellulales bacterium]|nr:sodium:proton antiporter [Pirellulales bacterium]
MNEIPDSTTSHRALLVVLIVVLICYAAAAVFDVPQYGTRLIVENEKQQAAEKTTDDHSGHRAVTHHPPYWMVAPFVVLLGAIAILPLLPATMHWWESNLHRFYVAAVLAALTLVYYLFLHGHPVSAHWPIHHVGFPSSSGANFSLTGKVLASAILGEYIPFIVLLFSLYTISGGIRIEGDLPAHPLTNCAFLAIGGLLASFIGTTGAAMLLIRPLLETNRERKHVKHTVVFFIFIVCNCGGLLLPIGDPPLFLGYLMGVRFLWTLGLWPEWLFVNCALIVIYWVWDCFWHYPREVPADITRDDTRVHRLRFSGVWPNVLLLIGVILSVGLLDPSKPLPGADWHPWMFMREAAQLALVVLSLIIGNQHARQSNRFNFAAIIEVAVLFFGIFICMQPALQILSVEGANLGLTEPWQYFWATGSLSSVLDNAPTYVVFFETAKAYTQQVGAGSTEAGVETHLLIAVSLGAVFLGAMTYIGNGPNFMVKAIAEKSSVPMPSFFGYMLYSVIFLIPLFLLVTFLFL